MYYRSANTKYRCKMMFYGRRRKASLSLAMIPLLLASSLAQPMRSRDTIFMFGNWRIDLIQENRSLQLVGMVTEGKGAFFSLQCFAESDQITILVPTFDAEEKGAILRRGFVQVTAWNDQSAPYNCTNDFVQSPLLKTAIGTKPTLAGMFADVCFQG